MVNLTDTDSYPAFHSVKMEDHPLKDITMTLDCIAAQIIYHDIAMLEISKSQNKIFIS